MSRNYEEIFTSDSHNPARDLMPPGRAPYAWVRRALREPISVNRDRLVAIAYLELDKAQKEGTLKPPLSEDLAGAVDAAACIVDRLADNPVTPFPYPDVGFIVLEAIFEHGCSNMQIDNR